MKSADKEADFENILLSLQSKERLIVFLYLELIFPAWADTTEISTGVESDYRNVMGALKGDGKRYSKKLALIKVGLVERKKRTLGKYKIYIYRANHNSLNALISYKYKTGFTEYNKS